MSKPELMARVEDLWKDCQDCALAKLRQIVVFWRGSLNAKLAIIGEAPGADEDKDGIPFVGRAGELLDNLLRAAGIDPGKDVFIINTVGCRPPGNRNPKRVEMAACASRLEAMLWIVKPTALLLMGAVATKQVAKVGPITAWRGEVTEMEFLWKTDRYVFPAVPTFHPSYLLRTGEDPDMRKMMERDMKVAMELANGIEGHIPLQIQS